MNRCVNIDWLEVYCLEPAGEKPRNAYYYTENGYQVSERDYGTRVYSEMFTILDDHDIGMIEIRRNPCSQISKDGGLFPKESCHIRLTNYYCYTDNPIGLLRDFLAKHGYTLSRIFRLDICLDYEKFDKGDIPVKFVQRYMAGRYSKVYQSNVSAHGSDTWEQRNWNSLSWGKKKSMISTKMYNKSLELREGHDKPYIRWAWYCAGLIDDPVNGMRKDENGVLYKPEIWRTEFSINSSAKRWFIIERSDTRKQSNIYMPHTLDLYDSREKLLIVFASLATHYFRFKYYEDGVRKDQCKDKILFDFKYMDKLYKVDRMASHRPTGSKTARLIELLTNLRMRKLNEAVRAAIDVLIDELEKDKLKEFVGVTWQPEDILILQRTLAERINNKRLGDITTQMAEISNMVTDLFEESF